MNPITTHQQAQECSICLNEDIDDKVTLVCTHLFHVDCLDSWFNSQANITCCPLCRRNVQVLDPKSVKEFILNAKSFAQKLDFYKSFDELRKANRLDPYHPEAQLAFTQINLDLIKHARIIFAEKKYDTIRLMSLSIEHLPYSLSKAVRAQMFRDIGAITEALLDLDSALRLDPQNIFARTIRGNIYYQQDRLREAFYDIYKIEHPRGEYAERFYKKLELELIASGVVSFQMECALFSKHDNYFAVIEEVD